MRQQDASIVARAMQRHRSIEAATAALAVSLLASCGGSDTGSTPASEPSAGAAPASSPEQAARDSGKPSGRWHKRRASNDGAEGDRPNLMKGLGYSGAYAAGGDVRGAVVHDAGGVAPGLTLVCSGHDTSVLLLDASGEVVHHWHVDFDELFGGDLGFHVVGEHSEFVRRAYPYPNGDLLLVFEYIGIARVDRDGKKVWAHAGQNHHDFQLLPDGRICTLGMRQYGKEAVEKELRTPRFPHGLADNTVVFLDPGGTVEKEISIAKAFLTSDHAAFMGLIPVDSGDVFHANSVDVISAEAAAAHPALDEGDVLVSMRTPSAVLAIDVDTEQVTWLSTGVWRQQHQAWALPSGHILLLDNCGGNPAAPLHFNRSRALEYDPVQQEVTWQFPPKGVDLDFFTHYLGYVERLPNGNTLITESTQGHLVEVTAGGDVVWEYFSPFRAGEDEELITTLMGARRIERSALGFLD